MKEEYYYRQMNRASQSAYRAMYDGFLSLSSGFPVLRLEGRELSEIFFRLRLDHPEIFYVESFHYRFTENSEYVKLEPEYMFEKKKVKEHQKALQARILRLCRPVMEKGPEEKEKYIHDFICENVTYDKLKKQYSHEIIGPLEQGVGVCEGIAKTVKVLCDYLGLECLIAISRSDPENGVRYRHAWNVIRLGKNWYHLDATFDNSLGKYGEKRFDYYNLDDKRLFRDHQPLIYPVPPCSDGEHFYYKENRLSLTRTEDVGKRLAAVLRKKQPHFVFHWRGGYLNRELLMEIFRLSEEAAKEKGKYVKMSVNYPQSVIQLTILEHMAAEAICREEANEGEADSRGESTEGESAR